MPDLVWLVGAFCLGFILGCWYVARSYRWVTPMLQDMDKTVKEMREARQHRVRL